MSSSLAFPAPLRALGVAATTATITLLVFYGVFMETDYGKALFFTYDEMWESVEAHEADGDLRRAERLVRHIVATEENRRTLRFGLFVLFAGPDYLIQARLKLAELVWRQGSLGEADRDYREAVAAAAEVAGPDSGWHALAHFRYAQFLLGTGRRGEGRQHLEQGDAILREGLARPESIGGAIWQEDEYVARRPFFEELRRRIADLRDRDDAFRTAPNSP